MLFISYAIVTPAYPQSQTIEDSGSPLNVVSSWVHCGVSGFWSHELSVPSVKVQAFFPKWKIIPEPLMKSRISYDDFFCLLWAFHLQENANK